ncbi:Cytoplasmic membrane protein [Minicystis rosea]|nr:Cytoplasmic membrane protein [Minicystis rosea]
MPNLAGVQRSLASFAVFFVIVSLVIGAVHYYLWHRLVRSPELGATWGRWGAVLFAFLALLTPVGMVAARVIERPVSKIIAGVAYGWMGLSVLLLFLLGASELVRVGVHGFSVIAARPLDPERRAFLSRSIAGVVSVLAIGLAGAGAASALGEVALRRVKVMLRRFPRAMNGFRIVQLSDVHIGPTLGADWLARVVDRVNQASPDVIVITGDLVDGSVDELRDQVAPLAKLSARHGVYFVTGNHEYYSGADEWIAELRRLGIRTLRNEHVTIGDGEQAFDLAGVDDWTAHRFGGGHGADLARAVAGRDPRRELVLLAHQPKQIHEAEKHGVGLQLSGHTHGGQIFPWNFFVRLDQPYIAGLSKQGDTHIYVSRGTGFWGPPMRVAAPAEISVVELHAA